MPVYEYKCQVCENEFEKFQTHEHISNMESLGFNAAPRCPECHSSSVRRIIQLVQVVYKDSDFTKQVKEDK